MDEVKFVERDPRKLKTMNILPRCYFCGGKMLPVNRRLRDAWKCEDCGAVLREGILQKIVNKIVDNDLKEIDKAKHQFAKSGGSSHCKKRKKFVRKREKPLDSN